MLRFGTISEVDAAKGVAKVKFEEDDIVSDWLRVSVKNTLKNKDEFTYDIGEAVWCMMDERSEHGVIAGSYYHDDNLPSIGSADTRAVTFDDGTKITYNRESKELTVDCTGDVLVKCVNATIEAEEEVIVDAPEATFKGNVTIEQDLTVAGDTEIEGGVHAQGEIESDIDVSTPTVSLLTHTHTSSTGPTGPPIPAP